MRINAKQEHLNAVSKSFYFQAVKCNCCGDKFKREVMWRYAKPGSIRIFNFCTHCKTSKQEVVDAVVEIESRPTPLPPH